MRNYLAALVALLLGVGIVAGLYGLSQLLAVQRHPLLSSPFLSGSEPSEHAVSRYHVRWYPATLLFLAFDMEMVFMYPWAVVVAEIGTKAVVEMFLFLGLLLIGVVYVWREGGLRWT
jgi:NADH-quinone oxidoreductase subunit A